MRELAAAAAALAKKCKRTKPKTEKENKVSEADSQLAAISYPNRQSSGLRLGLRLGPLKSAKNQNR